MKNILTQSDAINHEYCASVVRIGELIPIEGSDFLAKTYINGKSIVVRKDEVQVGDIMFYADNETVLNEDYLSVNNLYESSEFDRNSNAVEVGKLLTALNQNKALLDKCQDAEQKESYLSTIDELNSKIKSMTGFFSKRSRVRMIKLRGCPSMGFLFSKQSMAKYCPEINDVNLEDYIGQDFDTVNGNLFIKVYVPYVEEKSTNKKNNSNKRDKVIKRFDKMIPGQFAFHYDTFLLGKNMYRIEPSTKVVVSVKIHGTSAIYAHILTNKPKDIKTPFNFLTNILNKLYHSLPLKLQKVEKVYDHIYSSRSVIKNKYINYDVKGGYYGSDVWAEYNELLKDYIPEGMTIYGEIFGYVTNSQKMIQKNYDYGCKEGTNKFMPYRIVINNEDGTKTEFEVSEVRKWTEQLMADHPEIADKIFPIDILYEGTLEDLYPNANKSQHWHETVLNLMSNEKLWFMEKREPLCKNNVPREGVVLRIVNDPMTEAFKLKTNAFALKERDLIDSGEIDIEMSENSNYTEQ